MSPGRRSCTAIGSMLSLMMATLVLSLVLSGSEAMAYDGLLTGGKRKDQRQGLLSGRAVREPMSSDAPVDDGAPRALETVLMAQGPDMPSSYRPGHPNVSMPMFFPGDPLRWYVRPPETDGAPEEKARPQRRSRR